MEYPMAHYLADMTVACLDKLTDVPWVVAMVGWRATWMDSPKVDKMVARSVALLVSSMGVIVAAGTVTTTDGHGVGPMAWKSVRTEAER